jgi:DNA-directed RNA polymerase specialized sigma24 family protein
MRRFHPVITSAAVRVSRRWGAGSSNEIDDVVQEIYLKFCVDRERILGTFHQVQREAAFSYVKVVATNIASDFFRRRGAVKRGLLHTTVLVDGRELAGLPDDIERRLTLAQLDRLLIAATQTDSGVRDRAIFCLYFKQGMTAHAISLQPGVALSVKGVEAVLHRLTKMIRNAIHDPQGTAAE